MGKDDRVEPTIFEIGDKVSKPERKVLKPNCENDVESRLSSLESSISEIRSMLFKNSSISQANQQKKSTEKAEIGI